MFPSGLEDLFTRNRSGDQPANNPVEPIPGTSMDDDRHLFMGDDRREMDPDPETRPSGLWLKTEFQEL